MLSVLLSSLPLALHRVEYGLSLTSPVRKEEGRDTIIIAIESDGIKQQPQSLLLFVFPLRHRRRRLLHRLRCSGAW